MNASEHPPKAASEDREPAGEPDAGEPRSVNPKTGRRKRSAASQSGFVTAELAAVLPVVVAVLALSVWAVATAGMKVRAVDAANTAALAAARGEDARAAAAPYLPDGSSVSITRDGDLVRTTVTAPSSPLGVLTPAVEISAHAAALREPGLPE